MSKEDDRSLHQIKDVLILGRKHTYRLRHQGSHAKCLCLRKETLWVGFRAQRNPLSTLRGNPSRRVPRDSANWDLP